MSRPTSFRSSRTRRARRFGPARVFTPLQIAAGAALFMLLTCSAPLAPATSRTAGIGAAPTSSAPIWGRPQATKQPIRGGAATPTPAPAQAAPQPPAATASPADQQLAGGIDRYMAEQTSAGLFSGAVLVARGGQVILQHGYGPMDSDRGLDNTAATHFRLASVTKQFTAAAILILQQQGRLNIDDPICSYIDQCPAAWRPVHIRHLLNHTSGIVDYTDFADFEDTEGQPATPLQLVARFRDQPLASNPGDLYDYCNSGYVLLGLIIERASGMPYPEFIRQAIFTRLGMADSSYDSGGSYDQSQAAPYVTAGQRASYLNATTLFSAGGLVSTVGDLYRWDQALYTEQLLPRPLLDQMFTPGNGSYGFGWKIERPGGRLRISHAGNMTGVSNFIARYPEQRVTIIVLSNMEYANAAGISDHIATMVMGPTP